MRRTMPVRLYRLEYVEFIPLFKFGISFKNIHELNTVENLDFSMQKLMNSILSAEK